LLSQHNVANCAHPGLQDLGLQKRKQRQHLKEGIIKLRCTRSKLCQHL
jgi:hypothetical protein